MALGVGLTSLWNIACESTSKRTVSSVLSERRVAKAHVVEVQMFRGYQILDDLDSGHFPKLVHVLLMSRHDVAAITPIERRCQVKPEHIFRSVAHFDHHAHLRMASRRLKFGMCSTFAHLLSLSDHSLVCPTLPSFFECYTPPPSTPTALPSTSMSQTHES